MKFGYERVSSEAQNMGRQTERLLQAGVEQSNIFSDKISGRDMNRPALQQLLRMLRRGDELVVLSLDRLGRNSRDIITLVDDLNMRGVKLRLLDMGIDTDSAVGKMLVAVIAGLAEMERVNIKERQQQGIALAKAKGRHIGRPRKEIKDKEFYRVYEELNKNELNIADAARILGVSRATVYRRIAEHEKD